MARDSHLSLSIGHALWEELFRRALPVGIVDGEFEASGAARGAVKRLGVRDRVAGLLEDRRSPKRLTALTDRARGSWRKRKAGVYKRIDDVFHMEGTWKVELDDAGTDLRYGNQQISADAFVRGTASGTVRLLARNIEIPFTLTRRIGASVTLGNVHFSKEKDGVVGTLQDLVLHVGDARTLQLVSRIAEQFLEPQLGNLNPLPILKREQLEGLVGPLGGPLRMNMGVEMMNVEIDADQLTLKVRFGFTQAAITDGTSDSGAGPR